MCMNSQCMLISDQLMHWVQAVLAWCWNGAVSSLSVRFRVPFAQHLTGEVRTGIPQHSCKEQGDQMQALRTSQHCCQQSLAYPVWQSREEDLTDRSCSFIREPSLHRTESPQVVTWQSHAGLTSAINRASLWLLAKYFHNVCLFKL